MTDLTGRAALITGASRGIGHAIAAELLTRETCLAVVGPYREADLDRL